MVNRFRALYRAHDELAAAWEDSTAPARGQEAAAAERLEKAYAAWDAAIGVIDAERKKQEQAPGLQAPAKKALATLGREWEGIIAHRDYPMISIDNNIAERAIRGPVVTRKNAGGSHNGNTAGNAARIFTVTATARMAGLNTLTWLAAYLDECCSPRRKAADRGGTGTVPALDREQGRPPHLGPSPAIRIEPA